MEELIEITGKTISEINDWAFDRVGYIESRGNRVFWVGGVELE